MSIDFGDSRTGIAISDNGGILASGVETIFEKNPKAVAKRAAQLSKELEAQRIVVGMPKNMDGSIGFRGETTLSFIERLKKYTDLTIDTFDERLTTVSAQITLNEANIRGDKRKQVIDTVAAEIILQAYLDYIKGGKQNGR
ncbi:MAG: Holliday junction resolvase RuvX [Eubacteriales bacterium]|nr:Holliday junction resolvase RuvX [Eubacteriales bacterium]